jgi:major membrane immunogen (membrane-anchored lipoprotein)
MKKFIKVGVPVMAVVFLAACGANTTGNSTANDTAKHDSHEHMHAEVASTPSAGVHLKDDKLNAVYQHYIHLSTALVNGDAAEAKIASIAIETGAKEIAGGETIGSMAAKITAATDIAAQREAYSTLSNEFISLVKKSGLSSGTLYVDFCPMAMNDKGGYWISANKDIKNPYFGDKMLSCGEVKETIE